MRKKDTTNEGVVETIGKKRHVLQLMLYAFLYHQNESKIAEPSIVSFVSGNNTPFNLDLQSLSLNTVIEEFPEYIRLILEDIFDQDTPFVHQSKEQFSFCQHCD